MTAYQLAFHDRNGLTVLDRDECLGLLATVPVGRVAITLGALPVILPVNFSLSRAGDVVFRTGDGVKLRAALHGAVVAFEADGYDAVTRSGWSVLIQDQARVLLPIEAEDYDHLPLDTWAGIDHTELVVLRTERMSGRRLDPLSR